jgi:1-deoxy-D-xylulose-5-phosphate reductoisomerase
MQAVSLLGASGSVGDSVLKVLRKFPDQFHLHSFSVHTNLAKLKEIILEFKPKQACVSGLDSSELGKEFQGCKLHYNSNFLSEMVQDQEINVVVTAIVGSIGVHPTVSAIMSGKKIAIANKETLVTFGPFINQLIKKYNSVVVPVDSEHNALFQLISNQKPESIAKICLTASGGSFRDLPLESLENVSVEQALNHPTWKMGPKITIDSAGLINKGLEVIEAHFLFGFEYSDIEVVIHPQSIIHGLVSLKDGSYLSYASFPDMIYPVAHSLFYPKTVPKELHHQKPWEWKNLEFREVDSNRYPGFFLALEAGKKGGTAPAIFNAANEELVSLFLRGKIRFLEIVSGLENILSSSKIHYPDSLEGFLEADKEARNYILNHYSRSVIP